MKYILLEMRPKQWIKNFFVFAALIFDGNLFRAEFFIPTAEMFIAFCLVSSAVYFFNDLFDVEIDRLHQTKKLRPIASGAISRRLACLCSIILAALGLILSAAVNLQCLALTSGYVILNVLYTVRLKHVVILDIMSVAACFGLRAVGGAFASSIQMTEWFMLCVMFLSLLMIIGKRRDELFQLSSNRIERGRKVLKFYSLELLDQLMSITASALVMCYCLFALDPNTRNRVAMTFTVPLVLYGVLYYLYVVRIGHRGGAPDEILWRERPILLTALIYFLFVIVARNQ